MFTNIIRGGQLFLHAIRMFRQVFKFLIYITFIVAILIYFIKAYFTITFEELGAFYDLLRAKILIACWMKKTKISIYYRGGMVAFEAEVIPYVEYITTRANLFYVKLTECAYFTGQIISALFVILTIFLVRRGMQKSGVKFNRGAKLERFEEIKKEILRNNKSRNYKSYCLAGMPYPYYSEMEHTLIVGSTGVGKTVLISDLVEQIRARGGKAIVYDKKGDYVKWFYDKKKDIILNPFDKRGVSWNLLAEIEHVGQLKSLSRAFIPEKSVYGEGSRIWDEAARIAFTAILEKLIANGKNLTNQEIVDLILRQDIKEVAKLVKDTYAQSTIDLASPKTAASVLFMLATHFNSLRVTKGKKEESFSIKKWLEDKNRDSILFLSSQEDLSSELSPLITAWFELAISGILSLEQDLNRKIWIILDEVATLQKIPSLSQGLSVARSYGGCFVLGLQNIAQIREVYGKNLVDNISSECNTRCIFKANDPDTAHWMAQNIGESEVTEYKEGVSYGAHAMRDGITVNAYDKITALLLPSEIQNMKKFNFLLKMPDFPAVKAQVKYKERAGKNLYFMRNDQLIHEMYDAYSNTDNIAKEAVKMIPRTQEARTVRTKKDKIRKHREEYHVL